MNKSVFAPVRVRFALIFAAVAILPLSAAAQDRDAPLRAHALTPTRANALSATVSASEFSPSQIKTDVGFLASDALKGRMSGEPGNEQAARYMAQAFERAGLRPLGTKRQNDADAEPDGSGYFQPFKFVAGRALDKSQLELTYTDARPSTATAKMTPSGYQVSGISGSGDVRGSVVFVGYGIHAPKATPAHDDYANVDVKGKIALMLAGSPKDDPHSPLAEYADIRGKTLAARELGATAVLVIVPDGSDFSKRPRFDFVDASDVGIPLVRVLPQIVDKAIKGETTLAALKADANAGNNVSTLTSVTAHVVAKLHKIEKTTANVIGMVEGSDPILKGQFVVIGAHMDHLGMGSPYSLAKSDVPAIHHGADDNASGAAGVIALARYFSPYQMKEQPVAIKSKGLPDSAPRIGNDANGGSPGGTSLTLETLRPKRSLIFIGFSGEELGLLGSDYYVKNPIALLDKTVAMLNMDMIGRLRDDKLTVIGSGTAKEWDSLLEAADKGTGLTLAKSESGFGASDQQSFYTHDVPVLFFFTGAHSDYHTPTDTVDKINADGEARVLALVASCARRIADTPARPTFQRVQVGSSDAPSRSFRVYFGSVPDYAAMVEGVQLSGVREGSPAEKAGLKAGDIITKFGDRTIKNVYDYTYALQDHRPGDVVVIVVKRGAETINLTVTLAARPE